MSMRAGFRTIERLPLTRRSSSTLQLRRGVEIARGLEQPLPLGLDRRPPPGHALIGPLGERGLDRIAMLV
jgi:hypothetical protein